MYTMAQWNTVLDCINLVAKTGSTNEKVRIMQSCLETELLQRVLKYTYEARKVYGLGNKSIEVILKKLPFVDTKDNGQRTLFGGPTGVKNVNDIFELLDDLTKHPNGGTPDINMCAKFLTKQPEDLVVLYCRMIAKDLKTRTGAKLINKAFPDLIDMFEVMLAFPNEKYLDDIAGRVFALQKKHDGYRGPIIITNILSGSPLVRFFTRTGLELFDFPDLTKELTMLVSNCTQDKIVTDGEYIVNDSFSDTQKKLLLEGPKYGVSYKIYDIVTNPVFKPGKIEFRPEYPITMIDRYMEFNRLYNLVAPELVYTCVEQNLYVGSDLEAIGPIFEEAISLGWEGLILKLIGAPYQNKRTADMLKFKEENEISLKVLRVEKGKPGKEFEHTMGTIVVSYKGFEVGVGSGFNLEERDKYFKNPELIVDKIVEIRYNMESKNEQGGESLRFTRFKGIRFDKTEPDC